MPKVVSIKQPRKEEKVKLKEYRKDPVWSSAPGSLNTICQQSWIILPTKLEAYVAKVGNDICFLKPQMVAKVLSRLANDSDGLRKGSIDLYSVEAYCLIPPQSVSKDDVTVLVTPVKEITHRKGNKYVYTAEVVEGDLVLTERNLDAMASVAISEEIRGARLAWYEIVSDAFSNYVDVSKDYTVVSFDNRETLESSWNLVIRGPTSSKVQYVPSTEILTPDPSLFESVKLAWPNLLNLEVADENSQEWKRFLQTGGSGRRKW